MKFYKYLFILFALLINLSPSSAQSKSAWYASVQFDALEVILMMVLDSADYENHLNEPQNEQEGYDTPLGFDVGYKYKLKPYFHIESGLHVLTSKITRDHFRQTNTAYSAIIRPLFLIGKEYDFQIVLSPGMALTKSFTKIKLTEQRQIEKSKEFIPAFIHFSPSIGVQFPLGEESTASLLLETSDMRWDQSYQKSASYLANYLNKYNYFHGI